MRNHTKVRAVRQKFVNGYAVWSMLLEYLTGCDGNEFEYNDTEFELLSGDFGVSAPEIRDVVDYCIRLEMLFNQNGFIFSESLNERLAPVYLKRGSKKEFSKKQLRRNGQYVTETPQDTGVSVTETPQSKVKETEVNKTEVDESEVPASPPQNFSFVPEPILMLSDLSKKYKSDELWIASVTKTLSLKRMEAVSSLIDKFLIHLETQKTTEKTEKDFREHFVNWARKQSYDQKQPTGVYIMPKDHF